jgi:hypothetical protein
MPKGLVQIPVFGKQVVLLASKTTWVKKPSNCTRSSGTLLALHEVLCTKI